MEKSARTRACLWLLVAGYMNWNVLVEIVLILSPLFLPELAQMGQVQEDK